MSTAIDLVCSRASPVDQSCIYEELVFQYLKCGRYYHGRHMDLNGEDVPSWLADDELVLIMLRRTRRFCVRLEQTAHNSNLYQIEIFRVEYIFSGPQSIAS